MKVVSVNVGRPRSHFAGDRVVRTAIFKAPVTGRVAIRGNNVEGDRQADGRVHGGPRKAVYAYPSEHYEFWASELPDVPLPWGSFGENLTIEGLLEGDVHVGDRLQIGSAQLVVTQPREPCFKLGIRFERPDMVKRFWVSRRCGFYLQVAVEGNVAAGDAISVVERHPEAATISQLYLATLQKETRR